MSNSQNIINAAANGQFPCSNCGTINDADAKFCAGCGQKLVKPAMPTEIAFEKPAETPAAPAAPVFEAAPAFEAAPEKPAAPAFEAASTPTAGVPAFEAAPAAPVKPAAPAPVVKKPAAKPAFTINAAVPEDTTQPSPFAEGLPEWNITPPNAPVRRKAR